MKTTTFDQLVRFFAASRTRRQTLGGVLGLIGGSRVRKTAAAAGCCKCSGTTDCQDTNSENACKQVCGTSTYTFTKDATCTNKKCVAGSSEEETVESGQCAGKIDWLRVLSDAKAVLADIGIQDVSGTIYIRDRSAPMMSIIYNPDNLAGLAEDWIGTINQQFGVWNPENASGTSFDLTARITVDLFESPDSAKSWYRTLVKAKEDAGSVEMPEDQAGVNGFHPYTFEAPLATDSNVLIQQLDGFMLLNESTAVLTYSAIANDTPTDFTTHFELPLTIKIGCAIEVAEPLSDLILYPSSTPLVGIGTEVVNGIYRPLSSTTEEGNAPYISLYENFDYHFTSGVTFQPDPEGSLPFYLSLSAGVRFSDGEAPDVTVLDWLERLGELDQSNPNPPFRISYDGDVFADFEINTELFDEAALQAIIYPLGGGQSYYGAELTVLQGDTIYGYGLFALASLTPEMAISDWVTSETYAEYVKVISGMLTTQPQCDAILGGILSEATLQRIGELRIQ